MRRKLRKQRSRLLGLVMVNAEMLEIAKERHFSPLTITNCGDFFSLLLVTAVSVLFLKERQLIASKPANVSV